MIKFTKICDFFQNFWSNRQIIIVILWPIYIALPLWHEKIAAIAQKFDSLLFYAAPCCWLCCCVIVLPCIIIMYSANHVYIRSWILFLLHGQVMTSKRECILQKFCVRSEKLVVIKIDMNQFSSNALKKQKVKHWYWFIISWYSYF